MPRPGGRRRCGSLLQMQLLVSPRESCKSKKQADAQTSLDSLAACGAGLDCRGRIFREPDLFDLQVLRGTGAPLARVENEFDRVVCLGTSCAWNSLAGAPVSARARALGTKFGSSFGRGRGRRLAQMDSQQSAPALPSRIPKGHVLDLRLPSKLGHLLDRSGRNAGLSVLLALPRRRAAYRATLRATCASPASSTTYAASSTFSVQHAECHFDACTQRSRNRRSHDRSAKRLTAVDPREHWRSGSTAGAGIAISRTLSRNRAHAFSRPVASPDAHCPGDAGRPGSVSNSPADRRKCHPARDRTAFYPGHRRNPCRL